jgi:hypothetical protein
MVSSDLTDSGNEPYSASNLPFVGKSVAAILMKSEKTANKYLTVASFTITQREVLEILEQRGWRPVPGHQRQDL